MRDARAGLRASERGKAGVPKEVQHFRLRRARVACGERFARVAPMHRMFGEEREVAKRRGARDELERVPPHRPGFRKLAVEAPTAGIIIVGAARREDRVGALPLVCVALRPKRLRVWAHETVRADLLKLLSATAVQDGIVAPIVGDEEGEIRRGRRHSRVSARCRRA